MLREIDKSFTLRLQDQAEEPFSEKIRQQVDQLWAEERRKGEKPLFDGEVFQVLRVEENGLRGRFIPYRYFYAAHVQPKMFAKEPLLVCAVTGVTHADGRYLFARRGSDVTEDPLKWEFAPAGGISSDFLQEDETIDYEIQILEELEEEVGIDLGSSKTVFPFLLIHPEGALVMEICTWIDIPDCDFELIPGEYTEFQWLKEEEIDPFLRSHRDEITPMTLEIAKWI